jgi:hypothetical protein
LVKNECLVRLLHLFVYLSALTVWWFVGAETRSKMQMADRRMDTKPLKLAAEEAMLLP